MSEIDYKSSNYEIRADLEAAHQRAWAALAKPGTWLTGAERIAVARETRHAPDCRLCQRQNAALSPSAVEGTHDSLTDLPAAYVEIIHRVTNDPTRLSKSWFEGVIASGLAETVYVEIVAVIGIVHSVDVFCRTLDISAPALPAPVSGQPTRIRPVGAKHLDHWVATLAPEDLTPGDADIYADSNAANIYRALSLVPDEVRTFRDLDDHLYLPANDIFDIETDYRAISHAQIELIAGRVSANNQCLY